MKETQRTIVEWMEATFPGAVPESPRKALRALEEMVELCLASGATTSEVMAACRKTIDEASPGDTSGDWGARRPAPDKIPAEAADVLIVLYGVAHMRGFDLHDAVDRKMEVNRAPRGDGTGYHVKEAP